MVHGAIEPPPLQKILAYRISSSLSSPASKSSALREAPQKSGLLLFAMLSPGDAIETGVVSSRATSPVKTTAAAAAPACGAVPNITCKLLLLSLLLRLDLDGVVVNWWVAEVGAAVAAVATDACLGALTLDDNVNVDDALVLTKSSGSYLCRATRLASCDNKKRM